MKDHKIFKYAQAMFLKERYSKGTFPKFGCLYSLEIPVKYRKTKVYEPLEQKNVVRFRVPKEDNDRAIRECKADLKKVVEKFKYKHMYYVTGKEISLTSGAGEGE